MSKTLVTCAREGCGHPDAKHLLINVTVRKAKRLYRCTFLIQTTGGLAACDCLDFQRPGHVPKGTKRSIRRYSQAAEHKVADVMNGQRLGGVGQPDVVVNGPNGPLWGLEVKHGVITKKELDALDQAERLKPAGCLAGFVKVDKPGPGKEARMLFCFDPRNYPRLMEMLGVEQ